MCRLGSREADVTAVMVMMVVMIIRITGSISIPLTNEQKQ
jgi:hypothetical protein